MVERVMLITVNDDYRQERFRNRFKKYVESKGYTFVEPALPHTKELEEQVKNTKVFITFDANMEKSLNYYINAKRLLELKVKPINLITIRDIESANIEYAQIALGDVWSLEDNEISDVNLWFNELYYFYDTDSFFEKFEYYTPVTKKNYKALENVLKYELDKFYE